MSTGYMWRPPSTYRARPTTMRHLYSLGPKAGPRASTSLKTSLLVAGRDARGRHDFELRAAEVPLYRGARFMLTQSQLISRTVGVVIGQGGASLNVILTEACQ
ncbi:hypothetical protein TNCV_1999271 [Trichonephila clavipes]|nr:hypothetical protein TNCV_1999271 [Trichonephila clavipes]